MELTKEQITENLYGIIRFGGLIMSSEYVESVRIATEAYEQAQQLQTITDNSQEIEDKMRKLDEIRARIELEKLGYPPSAGYYKAIVKVLQIIDKYRAKESEEK